MKSHIKSLLLFCLISLFLIFSWFRQGYLYGGGDVGLQTYNPQRILENARYVWWDSTGPGTPLPQGFSAIPFQSGLYILQVLGFSPVAMQATLFFLLLTLMGFGIYLFLAEKLEDKGKFYPIIGGIFYMFNPYMMVQVWHRFIHTTIILAAALPFLAIFWNKWIREGKTRHLLFFMLTAFLSVYSFGTYAFILSTWIFLFFLTLVSVVPWQGKNWFGKVLFRFVFGFVIWILTNFWWLIPVSTISPAILSTQHKTEESLMTLITISSQEILPYSLQLINPFYVVNQADFGMIYQNSFFKMIPWVFVSVILLGFVNSFKQKSFSLFGIFYLAALFLAKGAAPPFGNAYIFAFTNVFALGVLRNPFEKTGLILVFFASILFALGIQKIKNITMIIAILAAVLIFAWPMFWGKLIGKVDKPAFVEVPQSYKEADQWLLEQKRKGTDDGKILHLPLSGEESIRYKWRFGYNGLEPSDTFFTAYPSISRSFNTQSIDDVLKGLRKSFEKLDSPRILGYLQDFNIRFIVLHKDVDWMGSSLTDPEKIEKIIQDLIFLTKKQQFGDLVIYQVDEEYFSPRITVSQNVVKVDQGEGKLQFWPSLVKQPDAKFISEVDERIDLSDREMVLFPKNSFVYGLASGSAGVGINYYVQKLKDLQPALKQAGMIQSLKLTNDLISLSGVLGNPDQYEKGLTRIFPKGIEINKFQINGEESLLSSIFRTHLNNLRATNHPVAANLEKNLVESNLKPEFFDNELLERQSFKFDVPTDGLWDLLMLDDSHPKQIKFFINSEVKIMDSQSLGNMLSFGNLSLGKGNLEISYPITLSENLALSAFLSGENIEIPIKDIKASSFYRLKGSVNLSGSYFYVSLYENQKAEPTTRQLLQSSLTGWQIFGLNFQTGENTENAKIVISSPTQLEFSDLKVQEVLLNKIFLRQEKEQKYGIAEESVKFTKKSPVLYEGRLSLSAPGFLFFKETFHPGWKLTLTGSQGKTSSLKHLLGNLYSNAWYIDQAGEYDFQIYFEPQNTLYIGLMFTGLGFIGFAGYWTKNKKSKV